MRIKNKSVSAVSILALSLFSVHQLGAQSQASLRTEVAGIVVDAEKNPVPAVELTLKRDDQSREVTSGADGHFRFSDIPVGPVVLSARRIGYAARSLNLDVVTGGASSRIEVVMEPVPNELASVIVEESKDHLAEFYGRKANSNFAKFFEQKDIKKRNPLYLSEMIRTVAGANVSSAGAGNRILLRGCKPMVWVDGMRAPGAELDEVARPGDIAGMEVYPSNAGLPAEYQDRNNRMCGAILVWTRNQ